QLRHENVLALHFLQQKLDVVLALAQQIARYRQPAEGGGFRDGLRAARPQVEVRLTRLAIAWRIQCPGRSFWRNKHHSLRAVLRPEMHLRKYRFERRAKLLVFEFMRVERIRPGLAARFRV